MICATFMGCSQSLPQGKITDDKGNVIKEVTVTELKSGQQIKNERTKGVFNGIRVNHGKSITK
ncbi:MAG: hypothetical protein HRT68_00365 [Flavobacteriaceae bacterium]|nr:hypothetical protein [Flavobacteriaceae bacterium]